MTITDRRSGSASASTASSRLGGLPEGLGFKAPCYLATTANITLSGVQTIDGVSATAGKRVLVKSGGGTGARRPARIVRPNACGSGAY